MQFIFVFLFMSLSSIAQAQPSNETQGILQSLSSTSLNDRIEAASFAFLGRPYVLGPLGEGSSGKYDQDPLFRTDAFDCTTFVETVIAMAQTSTLESFEGLLRAIRYKNGTVDFTQRNHFVEIDWNINNQNLGLLQEVTDQLVKSSDLLQIEQLFDKRAWYNTRSVNDLRVYNLTTAQELEDRAQELRNEGTLFSPQKNTLNTIPPSHIKEVLKQLKDPAVINVVRSFETPPPGLPSSFVVHQVLLVQRNGEARIRQASSRTGVMKVSDSSIDEFLESPIMALPKLVGINVQKILAQSFMATNNSP